MPLHTDIPTRSEVEALLRSRDRFCVSAYVPTSPVTQDAQAARIELKTLAAKLRDVDVAIDGLRGQLGALQKHLEEVRAAA